MIINRDTPECARCAHCSLIEPCTDSDVYFSVECRHMDRATRFETSINEDGCDCFSQFRSVTFAKDGKMSKYRRHVQSYIRDIADSIDRIGEPANSAFFGDDSTITSDDIILLLERAIMAVKHPDFDKVGEDD